MPSLVVLYERQGCDEGLSLDVLRNIIENLWHVEVKMYNMVVRIINSFFMILTRDTHFAPNNHLFVHGCFTHSSTLMTKSFTLHRVFTTSALLDG